MRTIAGSLRDESRALANSRNGNVSLIAMLSW
jgi:hypothetical protein